MKWSNFLPYWKRQLLSGSATAWSTRITELFLRVHSPVSLTATVIFSLEIYTYFVLDSGNKIHIFLPMWKFYYI